MANSFTYRPLGYHPFAVRRQIGPRRRDPLRIWAATIIIVERQREGFQVTVQAHRRPGVYWVAAGVLAVGAAVSVALGVYGSQHPPTGQPTWMFGFPSMIGMKVWLASAAGVLALVQLTSALWMYGKLGRPANRAVALAHRTSGTVAVLLTLPVAYHCLWSLGFQTFDTRVMAHALLGCIFYGAFVTKILALHTRSGPGWLLPLAGGLLLAALVVVVSTSSIWYFNEVGLPPTAGS